MTIRNNEDRVGAPIQDNAPVEQMVEKNDTFSFVTPTEFVELPTKGKYYPEGHPLHNQETVEIRYMTAKDEDILTSQTLLRKGIAIERLLQNVIVNKNIKTDDLYVGDKNAIIMATRITGYGSEYDVRVTCPACGDNEQHSFDLEDVSINYGDDLEDMNVTATSENTFVLKLPKSDVDVEVRLLTGQDERNLLLSNERRKKQKLPEATLTDQFKNMIVSVNGVDDKHSVSNFINNMPAIDSKYLRGVYMRITPNIDLSDVLTCSSCDADNETTIPFTTDFFWPK
jgi:hypothetical protein